jgi:hypothetical protein
LEEERKSLKNTSAGEGEKEQMPPVGGDSSRKKEGFSVCMHIIGSGA